MRSAPVGGELPLPLRVAVWDAAMTAVRAYFRSEGLAEVSTAVRLREVAIEPFIEPIAAEGGLLATSPELPMKQLVAGGAGAIFQIAPVLRRGEAGARHAEEFRLIEWYRPGEALSILQRDVEALVRRVFAAVAEVLGSGDAAPSRDSGTWLEVTWLDVFAETTGITLHGSEDALALREAAGDLVPATPHTGAPDVDTLLAWTALFTEWSDRCFDPWLAARHHASVHIVKFPPPLAALSAIHHGIALRLESHVRGIELANGYVELRDAEEQRHRFACVQGLRAAYGQPPLPMPETFLHALPAMPATVGCALGLDRLVMLACGRTELSDIAVMTQP